MKDSKFDRIKIFLWLAGVIDENGFLSILTWHILR